MSHPLGKGLDLVVVGHGREREEGAGGDCLASALASGG